jgi:hypothetical protein
MPGKYRPVSTAEKRAMLEAAGEEWPIGSDGLPMIWSTSVHLRHGGGWTLRSRHREASRNAYLKLKERASKDPVLAESIKKRSRETRLRSHHNSPQTSNKRSLERHRRIMADPALAQVERDRKRRSSGALHMIGLPPLSPSEGGKRTQDRYDRDPEAWARCKRGIRSAALKRTRTRLEGKASNG